MRVNLITQPTSHARTGSIPLSLTISPFFGGTGDYQCPTDSEALMQLLRKWSRLPDSVLERFENKLAAPQGTRLLGVDLGDEVLTDIGYFID